MSRRIARHELETTVHVIETMMRAAGISAVTASEVTRLIVRGAKLLQRHRVLTIDDAPESDDG